MRKQTLKEKFNNALDLDNDKYITYEFAIGFAEWINANYIVSSDFLWLECDTMTKRNSKELLEIYKKEKGL